MDHRRAVVYQPAISLPQRISPFIQDRHVLDVGVDAVALPAGGLAHDAGVRQLLDGVRDRREGLLRHGLEFGDRRKRTAAEALQHLQHRSGGALRPHSFGVALEKRVELLRRAHRVEAAVILGTVLLEIQAQVQQRLTQHVSVLQHERDE